MALKIRQQADEIKNIAFDINFALDGCDPEIGVHLLSLMLARYIMKSNYPLESYSHSKNILNNSFAILTEEINERRT